MLRGEAVMKADGMGGRRKTDNGRRRGRQVCRSRIAQSTVFELWMMDDFQLHDGFAQDVANILRKYLLIEYYIWNSLYIIELKDRFDIIVNLQHHNYVAAKADKLETGK